MGNINFQELDQELYANSLYETVKNIEGFRLTPYRLPGEDFDTIGLGFALKGEVREIVGTWMANKSRPSPYYFENEEEVKEVFKLIAPIYEDEIDQWLPNIPNSEERVALFSLAYNSPELLGPGLKAAIESGNRAEAWYEIRYNSNGGSNEAVKTGLAKRRYYEADIFGLYDTPDQPTEPEIDRFTRMVADHSAESPIMKAATAAWLPERIRIMASPMSIPLPITPGTWKPSRHATVATTALPIPNIHRPVPSPPAH